MPRLAPIHRLVAQGLQPPFGQFAEGHPARPTLPIPAIAPLMVASANFAGPVEAIGAILALVNEHAMLSNAQRLLDPETGEIGPAIAQSAGSR